jgi:hypothetical protein
MTKEVVTTAYTTSEANGVNIADIDFQRAFSNNIAIENAIVEIEEAHIFDSKMRERTLKKLLNSTDDYDQGINLGGLTGVTGRIVGWISERINKVITTIAVVIGIAAIIVLCIIVIKLRLWRIVIRLKEHGSRHHTKKEKSRKKQILVADDKRHERLFPTYEMVELAERS